MRNPTLIFDLAHKERYARIRPSRPLGVTGGFSSVENSHSPLESREAWLSRIEQQPVALHVIYAVSGIEAQPSPVSILKSLVASLSPNF